MDIHEIQRIISKVSYKNWTFKLGTKGDVMYLQVQFKAPCADDHNVPTMETQHGRKWWLSRHMTKSEIVQTALKAVLTAEEHEARERFRYCNRAIFAPHFDVDALAGFARVSPVDVRDGRRETTADWPPEDERAEDAADAFEDLPRRSLSEPWPVEGVRRMTKEQLPEEQEGSNEKGDGKRQKSNAKLPKQEPKNPPKLSHTPVG